MSDLDDLREQLLVEMRKARIDHDHKREIYASPYSGHNALVEFHRAWGYWTGIARALEVVDSDAFNISLDTGSHEDVESSS